MNKNYKFMDVLTDAYKNHYAVPAFDFFDLYDAKAMIEVAEEENSPLILMTLLKPNSDLRPKFWVKMIEALAEDAKVPVFLHLDHGPTIDLCKECVDVGYDSVMIDASALELDANIAATKEVVDYAHARGVAVEAEMGHIKNGKISLEGGYVDREDFLVHTDEAVKLVKATNVDFLAIGIGNQHGFYVEEPHIHLDRLQEVNAALGIPLVMHGGSGLPKDQVQESIRNGIAKLNVATDVASAFGDALRADIITQGQHAMFTRSLPAATEAAKAQIRRWIRTNLDANK